MAAACKDECATSLSGRCKAWFQAMGSTEIANLKYREGFAFIGQINAKHQVNEKRAAGQGYQVSATQIFSIQKNHQNSTSQAQISKTPRTSYKMGFHDNSIVKIRKSRFSETLKAEKTGKKSTLGHLEKGYTRRTGGINAQNRTELQLFEAFDHIKKKYADLPENWKSKMYNSKFDFLSDQLRAIR